MKKSYSIPFNYGVIFLKQFARSKLSNIFLFVSFRLFLLPSFLWVTWITSESQTHLGDLENNCKKRDSSWIIKMMTVNLGVFKSLFITCLCMAFLKSSLQDWYWPAKGRYPSVPVAASEFVFWKMMPNCWKFSLFKMI